MFLRVGGWVGMLGGGGWLELHTHLHIEERPVMPGLSPTLSCLCGIVQAAQHISYHFLIQLLQQRMGSSPTCHDQVFCSAFCSWLKAACVSVQCIGDQMWSGIEN